ncbi:MAG: hypothetical protein M3140_06280, partial [Actinomycetota bacterium]|nr:hypothetical protein [Actinomycetota bacterium]
MIGRRAWPGVCAMLVLVLALLAGAASAGAQPPGALDSGFGSGGVVNVSAQLLAVAVQPNGEIVAAGQSGGAVFVERLDPAGHPDGSYTGPSGYARGAAVGPDGKIVIAGASGGAMFVERLTSGLTPDGGFGSHGIAKAFAGAFQPAAHAVALQPDGGIVAAGTVNDQVGVARFSSSGGLEWSRGVSSGPRSAADGVAAQPADGKIVLVGHQTPSGETNGILTRLNPDGSLDAGFAGGTVYAYRYPGGGYTTFNSVALQTNGDIVTGGVAVAATNYALFARFNPDGSFETGFGHGGVTAVPAPMNVQTPGDAIGAYGVAIAGGGRIVSAGSFENTGVEVDAAQYALTPNGTPDPTFGSGGTARGPSGAVEACAFAVAPDGSLIAVGDTVTSFPDFTPCTVRPSAQGFVSRRIGYGPPPAGGSGGPGSGSAPDVSTGGAGGVTEVAATVRGQVNPDSLPTTFHFDYGTSRSYGSSTPAGMLSAGSTAARISTRLTGLRPATRYHYRLVATNADGTRYGADHTFTTT